MCSELEMKNRLHQECHARCCQEIEELKRRCYNEENGVTQQKLNEYSLQHDQKSRTVSLLRDQVRESQERFGTCTQSGMTVPSRTSSEIDPRKFHDLSEFQSWIVHFRTEVCSKAKNPTRVFTVDQGNRSSQIAG